MPQIIKKYIKLKIKSGLFLCAIRCYHRTPLFRHTDLSPPLTRPSVCAIVPLRHLLHRWRKRSACVFNLHVGKSSWKYSSKDLPGCLQCLTIKNIVLIEPLEYH